MCRVAGRVLLSGEKNGEIQQEGKSQSKWLYRKGFELDCENNRVHGDWNAFQSMNQWATHKVHCTFGLSFDAYRSTYLHNTYTIQL